MRKETQFSFACARRSGRAVAEDEVEEEVEKKTSRWKKIILRCVRRIRDRGGSTEKGRSAFARGQRKEGEEGKARWKFFFRCTRGKGRHCKRERERERWARKKVAMAWCRDRVFHRAENFVFTWSGERRERERMTVEREKKKKVKEKDEEREAQQWRDGDAMMRERGMMRGRR